jgi:hypothetical protein
MKNEERRFFVSPYFFGGSLWLIVIIEKGVLIFLLELLILDSALYWIRLLENIKTKQ